MMEYLGLLWIVMVIFYLIMAMYSNSPAQTLVYLMAIGISTAICASVDEEH